MDIVTKKRIEQNKDIVKRMKQGEPLMGKAEDTWFPPRQIIKKDMELVNRLYGTTTTVKKEKPKTFLKIVNDDYTET